MTAFKRTTTTKKILDLLRIRDDFLSPRQLSEGTGEPMNRISAALHWLKKAGAVNAMETDGQLWFYATPEEDKRTTTVDETKDGVKRPRKRRPAPTEAASGTNGGLIK